MKKHLLIFTLLLLACGHGFCSSETPDLKILLKNLFQDLIQNPNYDESLVDKYVSKDYVQIVDGKTFYYPEFKSHLKALKEAAIIEKVDFIHLVQDEYSVASVHQVEVKKNGKHSIVEVIALFTFDKDNKMSHCRELSHVVRGNKEDKELSSKH